MEEYVNNEEDLILIETKRKSIQNKRENFQIYITMRKGNLENLTRTRGKRDKLCINGLDNINNIKYVKHYKFQEVRESHDRHIEAEIFG